VGLAEHLATRMVAHNTGQVARAKPMTTSRTAVQLGIPQAGSGSPRPWPPPAGFPATALTPAGQLTHLARPLDPPEPIPPLRRRSINERSRGACLCRGVTSRLRRNRMPGQGFSEARVSAGLG
jgi:hypothetical protein